MRTRFLKIAEVIEDVVSFVDYRKTSVPQIKKIISDFVRKIETDEQLTHRVYLGHVKDYIVDMPVDSSIILQVAYKGEAIKPFKKMELVEWSQRTFDGSGCKYKITLDCPECHQEECDHRGSYVTINADDIWRQQHPEYQYMHMDHLYRWGGMNKDNIPVSPLNSEFRLIKYAQHHFHNADYHVKGCLNLDRKFLSDCRVEYTIPTADLMRLNVPDGEILISYMAKQVDEEGFHLVPDIPEVIEGIKWYYEEQSAYKEWRRTKDRNDMNAFKIAQTERRKMQGVIHELLQTPSYAAWMAFLANRWKRTMKDNNYYGHSNRFMPNNYESMMTHLTRKDTC